MKRNLLSFVLLLALVFSSCTSDLPEIEKVEKIEKTENTGGKEVLLGQVSKQEPAEEETVLPEATEETSPYKGVPNEYRFILDDFYLLSEGGHREEALDSLLEEIGFVEYYPDERLAYAVIDINKDGVLELFLGTLEGLKSSSPYSFFTLKNGKPILLGSFWSRNSGVVSADGTIYRVGSGGAAYTYLSSFRLDKNADILTQETELYSDFSDSEEKIFYIQVVDNTSYYITEDSFWDFFEEYDNPPERMKLTVISVE